MSWLFELVIFSLVIIFWMFFVQFAGILIFRLSGKNFSLNPWKKPKEFKIMSRSLSDFQFALWEGVVSWGWGMYLAIETSTYFAHAYFGEPARDHSAAMLMIGFLIWSAAGLAFGYLQRKRFSGELLDNPKSKSY